MSVDNSNSYENGWDLLFNNYHRTYINLSNRLTLFIKAYYYLYLKLLFMTPFDHLFIRNERKSEIEIITHCTLNAFKMTKNTISNKATKCFVCFN